MKAAVKKLYAEKVKLEAEISKFQLRLQSVSDRAEKLELDFGEWVELVNHRDLGWMPKPGPLYDWLECRDTAKYETFTLSQLLDMLNDIESEQAADYEWAEKVNVSAIRKDIRKQNIGSLCWDW